MNPLRSPWLRIGDLRGPTRLAKHSAGRFFFSGRRSGMTLLELIISLTIFVAVAFSLVVAFNEALGLGLERNRVEQAVLGLHNQLALLHAQRIQPQEIDLPDDASGIKYHLSVSQENLRNQDKNNLFGFYRVKLTADWKLNDREESRSVTEIFYQP